MKKQRTKNIKKETHNTTSKYLNHLIFFGFLAEKTTWNNIRVNRVSTRITKKPTAFPQNRIFQVTPVVLFQFTTINNKSGKTTKTKGIYLSS
jgi:hypothetical protein